MRQLRCFIADILRVVAVGNVGWNGVHWAGTVQGNNGDDILQAFQLQVHGRLRHAARFHLEHALCLARVQHFEHRRILVGNAGNGKAWLCFSHHLFGIVNHRQRAQPQEIHL